ncbi:MAG: hypothetical protein WC852_01415 [Candidatus Nanoarchaeia archaeon]|jgi:serine protein kinase
MVKELSDKVKESISAEFGSGIAWKGTIEEFLTLLKKDPAKYMRTSIQFLSDAIQHFGYTEVRDCGQVLRRYRLFDDPITGTDAVFGQDRMLMRFASRIKTIAEGGGNERIMVLRGPVATAKTTIVRLLMKGVEEYSKTPDGGVYTFNWVFPTDSCDGDSKKKKKPTVGFDLGEKFQARKSQKSYANLKKSDVRAHIPCQLNDSPLLLYPAQHRIKLLEDIIRESGQADIKIPKKIKEGKLCYNCQTIYNRLLEEFNGNIDEVFRHVQVERVPFSEMCKQGAATVQPIQNVDGNISILTREVESYSEIGDILRGIELFRFAGKWVDANRGIIHYTDIFKKNADYLQYLLSAVQENIVDFNGAQCNVDVVIIGTTNVKEYERVVQEETNKALISRIGKTIDVGYILQPKEEAKIYERQFNEGGYHTHVKKQSDRHICPHVVQMLSMWGVMTRLIRPDMLHYPAKSLEDEDREIIGEIDCLKKAIIYDGEIPRFNIEKRLRLTNAKVQRMLRTEFKEEGMTGVSTRTMQDLITDIITKKEEEEEREGRAVSCLRMERVKSALEELVKEGRDDFKGMNAEKDKGPLRLSEDGYRKPAIQIEMVYDEYKRIVGREIKRAIVGLDEDRRRKMVKRYIDNARAYVAKTKVFNPETNTEELPDERVMEYIEGKMGVLRDRRGSDNFRSIISKKFNHLVMEAREITKNSDTNLLVGLDWFYDNIFASIEHGLFEDRQKMLGMNAEHFSDAISAYGTEKFRELKPEQQSIINFMMTTLITENKYCMNCAKDTLYFAVGENIIQFEGNKK